MKLPIYLDYAATTPVDPRVAEKMATCLGIDGCFGNPASSSHSYGTAAKQLVESARAQVASLIHADPKEIIWTSGATESDNLAIIGIATKHKQKGKHIITVQTEHKAVLDTCHYLETQGFEVTYLKPKADGLIDLNEFQQALRNDTILASVMHVNNEIGVIQDIKAIGQICQAHGVYFHVDAAQSAGKLAINMNELAVDLMSFSAHKIYGPKGIGALFVRRSPRVELLAMIHGGGHEHGMRSGTLATHQIVGMGEAFAIAEQELQVESERLLALRKRLEQALANIEGITINGSLEQRVANNLNFSVAGVEPSMLLMALRDIAVSTSSACSSAAVAPSHVLAALGLTNEVALSSIRLSIGRFTADEEIDYTIKHLQEGISWLRSLG